MTGTDYTRRNFLRLAAGGATLLATGAACGSDSDSPRSGAATATSAAGTGRGTGTLRIAQWNHYVADYDRWWDDEYTKAWGERNGTRVVVDHFDINQALAHAEAEVASQRGHDLFFLNLSSPVAFEDHVIDHRELVEEVEGKVGKMHPFVERSIFNPKTGKYFGFSDFWSPNPVHYRTDLWAATGAVPDSWADVLAAGTRLKARGYPVGIGMADDAESNITLLGLMHAFGASVQDEDTNVVVNSRATIEAVELGAALFRSAMPEETLIWDITSNNRYLISGRGSLIVNSVAALRALETQDPDLASRIALRPAPGGPVARWSPYAISVFVIWKFSENQEAAKRFLVDLVTGYREPFIRSGYLQMPSFPGSVADVAEVMANDAAARPRGKYSAVADADRWSTNVGHPGHTNAAIDEVVRTSVISQMFAAVARGETSAAEAVKAAETRIEPIYQKWRERGKI